jgi:hypothetical protein
VADCHDGDRPCDAIYLEDNAEAVHSVFPIIPQFLPELLPFRGVLRDGTNSFPNAAFEIGRKMPDTVRSQRQDD